MRLFFVFMVIVSASLPVQAGEIEPRSYVNTPVGVNFFLAGYAYTDGGLSTVASSPLQNAELEMDTAVFAYACSFAVMGKSAKFDVVAPYTHLVGDADVGGVQKSRDVRGWQDPRFRFSVLFYGAPALSLKEFASYQQDLIIGGSVQVSAPLGQYDDDRLVNLGVNRWFVKPELGISKAWGSLALELSSGVFFYTNNHDYFGGNTLEQDSLYTSQLHLTYNFTPGMWLAVSATVDQGGQTQTNGVRNDDEQNNSRAGATFAMSLDRNNSIKVSLSEALHTNVGTDYDMIAIIWQHRWGGGL